VKSPEDKIELRSLATGAGGTFDAYTSAHITRSILKPSEAGFEIGDNGSYRDLREVVATGAPFDLVINGRQQLQGQVVMRESPFDARQSAALRCVFRTKLADMNIGAADPTIRVVGMTLKQLIVRAIKQHGMTERDVIFRGDVSRNVMTGKPTSGGRIPKDLEPLKEKEANVQPGETTFQLLARHLRRHGLMIWDGPDGRIVIAAPDDQQEPLYYFRCFRGEDGAANNVTRIARVEDTSGAPTSLYAFGYSGGQSFQRAKVSAGRTNQTLIDAGFAARGDAKIGFRPVLIIDEGIRTKELAERVVGRELSERLRRQDAWAIETYGLAYRERPGDDAPYAVDTTCEAVVDSLGGSAGRFYLEELTMRVSPQDGFRTFMQATKAGTWAL
jgi:prophage tail gpP-like protein